MDKYIKWELKNFFNKKKSWFIFIAAVYLLFILLPMESGGFLSGIVIFLFSLILPLALLGSFLFGAKTVVDSYKDKTFLLESMIPMPVKKTVFAKYIIGIIINLTFSLVTILGVVAIAIKSSAIVEFFEIIESLFTELSFDTIARASILYILSTVFFLSFVVLCFITLKVLRPNSNGGKITGFICWIIVIYSYMYIMNNVIDVADNVEMVTDIVYLILSSICYYCTAWLIENKLEIYK